ncbi:MAG: phosphoenolpyruvate--protein phosphotransferase [Desulfosalsimonadaceae bacterium]
MKNEQIHILEDIFQTISQSESPKQTLDLLVEMIALRLGIDVCSVYTYNRQENRLVLKATHGLAPESVGEIEMGLNEGLTGLAIEEMKPVFVTNPSAHTRFKYYAKSGEEKYKTFLGLPLIYHQRVLGVLVLQTILENRIQEKDIPVFANIASQISATVAYTGLLENAVDRRKDVDRRKPKEQDEQKLTFLHGEAVSDRVAEGRAYYLPENIDFEQVSCTPAEHPDQEVLRINDAFRQAAGQIKDVLHRSKGVTDQEMSIIDAHLMFLKDPNLKQKIVSLIEKGMCAEFSLKQVILEYVEMFRKMEDAYLSERAADVLDIGHRVLGHLMGIPDDANQAFTAPTIVVASDISPVDLLAIRQPNLKGVALARGGKTSHTVILAKSLEIPIVIGVEKLLQNVRQNDFMIIDGASGLVFVNPEQNIREEYAKRNAEDEKAILQLSAIKDLPAETRDGKTIGMGANIGLLSDMALVNKYGADHIGLYRTEFPFLLRKSFPTEEEQVTLYRKMVERADARSVTIRTFDVGGDKFLSYLDSPREENPFLGWRSIRISLELAEEFSTQIRAILQASAYGSVNILFPMISSVEEIRLVSELLGKAKKDLDERGIAYDENIRSGIMIEVPSAVFILERLLKHVDFISIGTNDLIQYLLAVDRNNKKVATRYNSLHPSVIDMIREIVKICRENGKFVSICGEAAASLDNLLLYVGMEADAVSMNPSSIPLAKQFIRNIRQSDAKRALDAVGAMEDAASIAAFLADFRTKHV